MLAIRSEMKHWALAAFDYHLMRDACGEGGDIVYEDIDGSIIKLCAIDDAIKKFGTESGRIRYLLYLLEMHININSEAKSIEYKEYKINASAIRRWIKKIVKNSSKPDCDVRKLLVYITSTALSIETIFDLTQII